MSGTNLASVYLLYIGLLHLMTIQEEEMVVCFDVCRIQGNYNCPGELINCPGDFL